MARALPSLPPDIAEHLAGFQFDAETAAPDGPAILKMVEESFGRVEVIRYKPEQVQAWIDKAQYRELSPAWWKSFSKTLSRKLFEHFAAIDLMDVKPGGSYMDAAASVSPMYRSLPKTHQVGSCYRQDLNLASGINGDEIGSNAEDIPLPDASLDGIVATNSWEHFEGASALGFVRDSVRLLKTGGKLVIIPLNMATRLEITTSPSIWGTKYRNAKSWPDFDRRATIVINEEKQQRQALRWRPDILKEDLDRIKGMTFKVVRATQGDGALYSLVGTRVG
jgi:hypothetical protein